MRLFPLAFLIACSGFKSGDTDAGGDAKTTSDSAMQDASGTTGPGPHGALPTGYCCNSNLDCRQRNCVDFNGSKMCMDYCRSQDACDGALAGLTCVGGGMFMDGTCRPSSPTTQCVPANQYMLGAKKLGACCTPTWNGANGFECEGGHCGQSNNGDFMCTNACEKAADCPGPFMCSSLSSGYNICVPLNPDTLKCTP